MVDKDLRSLERLQDQNPLKFKLLQRRLKMGVYIQEAPRPIKIFNDTEFSIGDDPDTTIYDGSTDGYGFGEGEAHGYGTLGGSGKASGRGYGNGHVYGYGDGYGEGAGWGDEKGREGSLSYHAGEGDENGERNRIGALNDR